MPDEDKTPMDQALDLFVYAPLGFALSLREQLPKLAERGRQQVQGQVTMARMVGQFAAQQGQREAEKLVRQAGERAEALLVDLVGGGDRSNGSAPRPAASSAAPQPRATEVTMASTPSTPASPVAGDELPAESTPVAVPPVDDLAIPGYDTLSASQVVQRLAGLSSEERAAVEAYEGATRRRRTILNRIAQLESA